MSKTDDGSSDLLTSQALIESDVPSCSMRNIQVYKTGADLKARKTERQRESERKHRVEIQQQLEIRTLESAADRAKENRQRSLEHM